MFMLTRVAHIWRVGGSADRIEFGQNEQNKEDIRQTIHKATDKKYR